MYMCRLRHSKIWRSQRKVRTENNAKTGKIIFWCNFKGALTALRQFLATENPLKRWKMLFISPQKLFLFSRYLSFCLDFLVNYRNNLIKKIRSISNFMTSQPGYQTLVIHILPSILKSNGNQTMKFNMGNMGNIFLEKIIHKMKWRNYSQTLFWKFKIEHISESIV